MEKGLVFIIIAGVPTLLMTIWIFSGRRGAGSSPLAPCFFGYMVTGSILFVLTLVAMLFKGCS